MMKTIDSFAIAMDIINKIRNIRLAKGYSQEYTQEYMASQIGIDAVNYGRIERGQAKLTVDRLIRICEILDIKPSELFMDDEERVIDYLEKIYQVEKEILQTLKNKQ